MSDDQMNSFATEEGACARLAEVLAPAFHLFREVDVRHALFRTLTLRVDVVAIPKAADAQHRVIAFEVKSSQGWDTPRYAKALKQGQDYVLSEIVGSRSDPSGIRPHIGRRILAVFLFPGMKWASPDDTYDEIFHSGMGHLAGYMRVGQARFSDRYRERPLVVSFGPNEVWLSSRGWRADAENILLGKRQIGSQRKTVLDLLQ